MEQSEAQRGEVEAHPQRARHVVTVRTLRHHLRSPVRISNSQNIAISRNQGKSASMDWAVVVGDLDKRTRGPGRAGGLGDGSTQESGTKVEGAAGKPDDEDSEGDAAGSVPRDLLTAVARSQLGGEDGRGEEDSGEEVDSGDGHQEEEGRLQCGAVRHKAASSQRSA